MSDFEGNVHQMGYAEDMPTVLTDQESHELGMCGGRGQCPMCQDAYSLDYPATCAACGHGEDRHDAGGPCELCDCIEMTPEPIEPEEVEKR